MVRDKPDKWLRRIRPRCFDYDDAMLAKAHRIIGKLARLSRAAHERTLTHEQRERRDLPSWACPADFM